MSAGLRGPRVRVRTSLPAYLVHEQLLRTDEGIVRVLGGRTGMAHIGLERRVQMRQRVRRQSSLVGRYIFQRREPRVLLPASWKAPAKHARGNIFDDDNGLRTMGPYGPGYIR